MAILQTCCCCCTLKQGTVFSGVLGVLIGVVTFILVLCFPDFKVQTIVIDSLPQIVVRIILCINLLMTVLISVLLIIGALKRNQFMMLPWVVLAIMLAVGILVSVIYTAVVMFTHNNALQGSLWLVFGFISIAIYVYLWFVVFSYFQTLREDAGRGSYGKAPYRR